MKKLFILLVVTLSFQGFLLAQQNSEISLGNESVVIDSEATVNDHIAHNLVYEPKDNALDDLDAMFDDADTAMGDITPVAQPEKHNKILAVCAYLLKNCYKITRENILKFFGKKTDLV